jgi:hypothetical protein
MDDAMLPSGGRWQALFADLDSQFDAEERREAEFELADRIRHELGRLSLVDRLRGSCDRVLRLGVRGCAPMTGVVADVGPDWVLVGDGVTDLVVATSAIVWVDGLGGPGEPASGIAWATPDLRRLIRGLAQERAAVVVALVDGPAYRGVFAGVFADHVELACDTSHERSGPDSVGRLRAFPLGALATIRRTA